MAENLTSCLAGFASGGVAPSETALTIARLSALDWIAVGRAGVQEPVSRIVSDLVLAEGGTAQASVFGSDTRVPARAAALVNGTISHALDYDDTHFAHIGHPSVAVFPAALAVVGLLRGSFVFIADLVRELDLPIEVDFIEASSYGDGMKSSREVRILKDLRAAIEGRDVLVVEDIVDTGHTLKHVMGMLRARKPARLKSIALLNKSERREVDFTSDWIGFEIPDEFVVGYGIDFAQRNRNLPYIGKVRFT